MTIVPFQPGMLGIWQLAAFLILFALYSLAGAAGRRLWLILAGNLLFLAILGPRLAVLSVLSIGIVFICCRLMSESAARARIPALVAGIGWCLLLLAVSHAAPLRSYFSAHASFSFFSLLLIGILLDCYWERAAVGRDFLSFTAATSFFPVFAAGPIERASSLLPQMQRPPAFEYARARSGMLLLFTGVTKKFVIAAALFEWIEPFFRDPARFHPAALALALFLARYWLYWDFSAYSDIARGCARMFGIEVRENFRSPFMARSPLEFWSRWHMSLTSWVRDYVYFPLLVSPFRHLGIPGLVLISFLVLGLWHGFTAGFLLFWMIQGIAVLLQGWLSGRLDRIPLLTISPWARAARSLSGRIVTLAFLVSLPMVFLIGESTHASLFYLKSLTGTGTEWHWPALDFHFFAVVAGCALGALFPNRHDLFESRPAALRWAGYALWILYFLVFGRFDASGNFAYFRF